MANVRITPFLIVNPIIIVWAIYALVVLQIKGGFAVIMSDFIISVIFVSIVLLIIDRLIAKRVNAWILFFGEVLVILGSMKLTDWYLYG